MSGEHLPTAELLLAPTGKSAEEINSNLEVSAANFMLLYRAHNASVYRYLCARLGNRLDAEDLTATTFQQAWSSLSSFSGSGSFRGWLLTIARRALARHYQSSQPPPVDVALIDDELTDPASGPEELALERDQLRQALRLIATLSDEQQEVISLRFMAELSYKEIAQISGKSEAAVKMISYRALSAVRERYANESR